MSRIFIALLLATAWLDAHAVLYDRQMEVCNNATHFCSNRILVGKVKIKRPFSPVQDDTDVFCVKPRSPSFQPVLVTHAYRQDTLVIDGRVTPSPVEIEIVLIKKISQRQSNGIDSKPFERLCALL